MDTENVAVATNRQGRPGFIVSEAELREAVANFEGNYKTKNAFFKAFSLSDFAQNVLMTNNKRKNMSPQNLLSYCAKYGVDVPVTKSNAVPASKDDVAFFNEGTEDSKENDNENTTEHN